MSDIWIGTGDGLVGCTLVPAPADAKVCRLRGRRLMFLTDVYTSPGMRRSGCGHALLTLALAYAKARRIDLCLYAHSHGKGSSKISDAALERWYANFGFIKIRPEPQGWMVWRYDRPA